MRKCFFFQAHSLQRMVLAITVFNRKCTLGPESEVGEWLHATWCRCCYKRVAVVISVCKRAHHQIPPISSANIHEEIRFDHVSSLVCVITDSADTHYPQTFLSSSSSIAYEQFQKTRDAILSILVSFSSSSTGHRVRVRHIREARSLSA